MSDQELPAPPLPPDVDLRGLPFMPLDTVRLIDSDIFALSTGDEFKAAVALWCKAWQQVPAASLPDDDRILAHLSGAGARWKKVKAMALRGFIKCSDGRLYHSVIAEKAIEAWGHRVAQRNRAAKRWHPEEQPSGNATAMPRHNHGNADAHTHCNADADATAMQGRGRVKGQLRDIKETTESSPLPLGLDPVAWEKWLDYRRQIKKPFKPVSIPSAQKKLASFGDDQMAVVEQSIANGWQGLFALKDGSGGANSGRRAYSDYHVPLRNR